MSPRTAGCVDAASLKNRRQGSLPPILRLGAVVEGRRSGFADSIASIASLASVASVASIAPVAPVVPVASVPVFVDFSCLTPAPARV